MKRIAYILLSALLFTGVQAASAQQKKIYNGQVGISTREFNQKADSVYVTMDFRFAGLDLDNRRSLELIPVIESKENPEEQNLHLPGVNVNGRIRQKARTRAMRLSGLTPADWGYYAEIAEKTNTTIVYRWAVPYSPWMAAARLNLIEDMCGCGGAIQQINVSLLAMDIALEDRVQPYAVNPLVTYITPEVEAVKRRAASGEAALTFLVSKTDIRPELGNNQFELAKIRELIDGVRNSRGVTIRRISIIGWASPEGTLANNKRLSEGRATALRNYVALRYDMNYSMFDVKFGGENWNGLRRAMEKSDYGFKYDVLDIIDMPLAEDAKEARLRRLQGGTPFKVLAAEVLPDLRRVEMVVDYDVSNFSIEEAKEVLRTDPHNLSLNEMFILANSYGEGTADFNNTMETAARMFPTDDTANLNAAAAALARGDLSGAEEFLSKVSGRGAEYNNNMGVLSLLRNDLNAAREYFTSALQGGLGQAAGNLTEVLKKEENMRQIEEQNKKLGLPNDAKQDDNNN